MLYDAWWLVVFINLIVRFFEFRIQGRSGWEHQDLIYVARTFGLVNLLEVAELNVAKSDLCGQCGGVLSVLDHLQGRNTCCAPASASVWPTTSQCCRSAEVSAMLSI